MSNSESESVEYVGIPGSSCEEGIKRKRRAFASTEKSMVLSMYNNIRKDTPDIETSTAVKAVSEALGISERSVYNIIAEKSSTGELRSPKRTKMRTTAFDKLDELDKDIIRRKIHAFFFAGELPTLDKILKEINSDENLPHFSRTGLHRILKKLHFKYVKRGKNSLLIDKPEIMTWRRDYLRQLRKFRNENRNIFYLDETWVTSGHTKSKIWKDEEVTSARQAFIEGLSTGLKSPSGKGQRLIIAHIGNRNGFVDNALLMFQSKKSGDYHEDMNAAVFESWFGEVLNKLPRGSVIVMDNASYHSKRNCSIPTTKTKKDDIKAWLTEKGIEFREDMIKTELLKKVRKVKSLYQKFIVDEMAKEKECVVLRTPPYHCELNPIELIWAQVKGKVAAKNTTFKLKDNQNLLLQEINSITSEQ